MLQFLKKDSEKEGKVYNKESVLINFMRIVFWFFMLYAIKDILTGKKTLSAFMFFSGIAEFFITQLFIRKKLNYSLTVNLGLLIGLLGLCFKITLTDGIFSPALPWIISFPVISFLMLEHSKSTMWWIFISICVILFFGILNFFGFITISQENSSFLLLMIIFSYVGLVLMLVIITIIFENKKNSIYKRLEKKQLELQESEIRFRTMFEKAPLGIALTNSNTGIITEMNGKYLEIVEKCTSGKNDLTGVNENDLQNDLQNLIKLKFGEIKGFKATKKYISKNNSEIWIDIAINPINSEDKTNPFYLCMIEDITERKSAETIVKSKEIEKLEVSRNKELLSQQNLLLDLSTMPFELNFEEKIKSILKKSAQKISCGRVSIWRLMDNYLKTEYVYDLETDSFLPSTVVKGVDYLLELEKSHSIVCNYVELHPLFLIYKEFFSNEKITSTLDVSIQKGNDIIGAICCEHIGKNRNWTIEEQAFIRSISDIVSLTFEMEERKKAEEELQQSKGKLQAIFTGSNDAILLLTKKGFFDCNPKALEMFELDNIEELINSHPSDISPAFQPDGKNSMDKADEMIGIAFERGSNRFEWIHKRKNGQNFPAEVLLSAFNYGGERVLQATVLDITERKLSEKKVKQSLYEKEVLLKEVHHRVKNNLQIISSILSLQSFSISDQQTIDLLTNSQNRIRSMSLIHELLYQTKDFSTINFSEYIRSISTNLFQSYNQSADIHLITELEELFLDLDLAIPCGLIINELVTNSLKYAFDINGEGEVKIQLSQKGDDVLLKMQDNGKGFPETINFRATESLGMQLVVSLVDQIDGEIVFDNSHGTSYEIRFKNIQLGGERLIQEEF